MKLCLPFAICLLLYSTDSFAEYVPGEILVKFKDSATKVSIQGLNAYTRSKQKKVFKKLKIHHIKLPKGTAVKEALQIYQQDPDVEYAEPNYIVSITATSNDLTNYDLWGLNNTGQNGGTADADIDAPEAWDLATGSTDVVIAVVDSGIAANHPDLTDNIWVNASETSCLDGIDNDGNGYIDDCYGWDFLADDKDPTDYNGHGTHVSGTIAAVGNNNIGVTGVMWKAQIMPLRILGEDGTGTTADAISAILYANANGAHVINNSWGGPGGGQALKAAIDASSALVVCAAGNDSADNDSTPFYPASYDSANIIAVAATDRNDNLASFSNYGLASVDLAAPGNIIYSSNFTLLLATGVYTENFDGDSGDLPVLGWDRDVGSTWAVTTGTGNNGTNSLEDSPSANYENNTNSWAGFVTQFGIYSPPFIPVSDNLYTLSFDWKGDLEDGLDYLYINYSLDGTNWNRADSVTGNVSTFTSFATKEITSAAELLPEFYIGVGLYSNGSTREDGVYIDDVLLIREKIDYVYGSQNGTSMATPHVSGVAGLIKSLNASCSTAQIKSLILNNTDAVGSLSGKILTEGRLNAFNALSAVQCVQPAPSSSGGGGGGGCFIATAAFGNAMHPYVKELRNFRDRYLLTNVPGRKFVTLYYQYSPAIADLIRDRELLKILVRIMLTPIVMLAAFPYASLVAFIAFTITTMFLVRTYKTRMNIQNCQNRNKP